MLSASRSQPSRFLGTVTASHLSPEPMIRDRGVWKVSHALLADPSDPLEARRVAIKYTRKRIHMFDTSFRMLTPQTCFEDVAADGTNTILLIPESTIDTDNLPTSVSEESPDLQTNSEVDPLYSRAQSRVW